METPTLPSLPRRVVDVVFSPGRVFAALSAHPAWFGALMLGAVLGAMSVLFIPPEIFEATMRRQILERGGDLPANLEQAATFGRIAAVVGALIVGPLVTAAFAGIVALVFVFVLGDEGGYRQHLASVSHAFLVPALSGVLVLPLRISAEDMQLRLSVGTFFPFLDEGWFAAALSWLDLFGLWGWVLVALGASKIAAGRSWGSATAILLCIVILLTFGFALIFAR